MADYSDDEQDQDFYEDDEEDASYEGEAINTKRKGKKLVKDKKKKSKINQFFEEDAEESDGEEDEEITQERRQRNKLDAQIYTQRRARQMDDVIKDIEQGGEGRYNEIDDDIDDEDIEHIPENLKKHGIKQRPDQKIFSVPVRKMKEREVVICLLNKFAQLNPQNNYGIYSISQVPSSESIIYIEGRSKRDVLNFLDKYPDVNCNKVELVNIDEFMGIFQDQDKEQERYNAEIGQYVKINPKARSDYINDIGQIYDIKKNNRVLVKLIPRVNIEQMRKKHQESKANRRNNQDSFVQVDGDADQEENKKKPPFKRFGQQAFVAPRSQAEIEKGRPQQQFFPYDEYHSDFAECYKAVSEVFIPENDKSDGIRHCGYVYKTFHCKDLIFNQQPKTLEELKKFYPHLDLDEIMHQNSKFLKMASYQTTFVIGDSVLINGGQLKGLKGKIVSINKETAKVAVKQKKATMEEEIELKDLVKSFDNGARVKVISGTSEGITGTVLSSTGDICEVFTDNNNTIEVRTKDLAITGEVGQEVERIITNDGNDKNLGLKKKDLVKLTGFNSVGLILDISKDYIKILDSNGKIRNVSSFSINAKIDTRKYIGKNAEGNNITNNSNIIIKQGQYSGYQCQVIHAYKTLVFLFNPKFRDTYTVENINNVSLQTTNPVIQRQEARIAYDMKYGKSENLRADDMKQYVGRQMRIIGGKYKGFQCTVIDIRNDQVKVEINSKFITVFIPKQDIIASDKSTTELEYGKTPSYVTQSTYQPSVRETALGSPTYH